MTHIPVLLKEAVDGLDLTKGETFLDGTLGGGGHSALVAERFGESVRIIGLDRDRGATERSEKRLRTLTQNVSVVLESFRNIDKVLEALDIEKVDAILLDIGISSDQLETAGRGFSFQKDEPLLMTMSEEATISAKDILNAWDEETLELILRGFGEEKYSRRIAKEIVSRREVKLFETTSDLVEAIRAATPSFYHRGKLHPATRTFQALRIAVNEELVSLQEGLEKGFEALSKEGRFAVISFHSLEDRIVKTFFREREEAAEGKRITKKPITPSEEEVIKNPRARSAKLRILEKL